MLRGKKPLTDFKKQTRGTLRKHRVREVIEVTNEGAGPKCPDWLTAEGEIIWLENVERIRGLNEIDTVLWAHYCNLAGAIAAAWRSGEPPPNSYAIELRRLSELFGIAGAKNRVGGVIGTKSMVSNPFAKFKKEPVDETR